MANYTQYDGSMNYTSMGQRLLDNGSDYFAVRIGQYQYLFVQGKVKQEGSSVSFSGDQWIYTTSYSGSAASLDYSEDVSGSVSIAYPDYLYSSLRQYQSLDVQNVYPKYCFISLLVLIFVTVGFSIIKKRWIL